MKFQLKNVQPNPFRHTEKYPILREKVEELKESIESTEFWNNIVARLGPDGKPQIAYGHHRLVALRELYSGAHEINLIVRKLSDAVMIKMMARENSEIYKTNAIVLLESVRATVQAYADGKILPAEMPVGQDARESYLRDAPSYSIVPAGRRPARPYTMTSLGDFLGMLESEKQTPNHKLQAAVSALELIEQGYLSESKLQGIGVRQLLDLVRELQRQRDVAETKKKP